MNWVSITGLIFVLLSTGILVSLSLWKRKKPPTFRDIPAYTLLDKEIGLAIEDGSRVHSSLGRSSLLEHGSAASFAALGLLRRISELTSVSDQLPIATSGDAALAVLTQDVFQSAYQTSGAGEQYHPSTGRVTGLTPFSYAAGSLPAMRDENVSVNILLGSFGVEAGLLTDTAERENSFILAAADGLPAQAILYASLQDPLIGEELYAAGAYVQAGQPHTASLQVQDILRWVFVVLIMGGAVLRLIGLL